jgi:hypothetical protein
VGIEMKAFVVAFCGVLLASPAVAQTSGTMTGSGAELSGPSTPETGNDSNARTADGEHRICRRVEISSGSRMATRRVCHTAEEWRAIQNASQN